MSISRVELLYSYIFLHWFSYIIATALFICLFQAINFSLNSVFTIKNFKHDSILHTIVLIAMCSIMGVPPFIGFWTKLALLQFISTFAPFWLICTSWLITLLALIFYTATLRNIAAVTPYTKIRYKLTQRHLCFMVILCAVLLVLTMLLNTLQLFFLILIL